MKRRVFLGGLAATMARPRANAQDTISNANALSGDRFTIGDAEFALADIIAPPLHSFGEEAPAYFENARRALQGLMTAELEVKDSLSPTRWGARRVVAWRRDDQLSLQEILVASGAVRVAPQSGDHDFIKRLYTVEAQARRARKGLWALEPYQPVDALRAEAAIGGFHLIEGVVRRAGKFGSRIFLNFDDDFRTDFTATAASTVHRRWVREGFDLLALNEKRLRIRGYVLAINGPSIELKHPLQTERLS